MKKIKILFCLLIIGLITLCYNVKAAEDEEITDTKKLSAKCVYTGKKNWYVYIDKNYEISVFSPDVKYGRQTGTVLSIVDSIFNFNQEIFVGEDGNISCENVSSLYVKLIPSPDAYDNCDTDGTQCYRYDLSATNKEYYEKLTLNKEKSEVYVENAAKEEVESGNWDLICNYGKYYLFYNNTTFETNAYNKNFFTHDAISDIINENYGSCPTTYCEYTVEVGFGFPVTYSGFTNEYESRDGCYVSQQYANEYSCGILDSRMKIYHNAFSEFDNSLIIKTKEEIKKFCSNVFSNLNYTDSNDCVKECMEVVEIIQKDQNLNQGQCGLSSKLILWIANIVKWLKYIVPVIVIVLGILDFIKAIGTDKDDEMKKAQGRFVKRLIAAALIFIIPFIIEFVLDKMGFTEYISGCGIIDL